MKTKRQTKMLELIKNMILRHRKSYPIISRKKDIR